MTEAEWNGCEDPRLMLEFLRGKANDRKLRLFACAWCQSISDELTKPDSLEAITAAEQYADGLLNLGEMRYLATEAWAHGDLIASATGHADAWLAANDVLRLNVGDNDWSSGTVSEPGKKAALLRHVGGNPFRPYPAPPSWPAAVVSLAEAVYNGADATFALHDALLEAGHPELAEHFQAEHWHPKGCWVVDLLLGKE
jgi:hypothetical protein